MRVLNDFLADLRFTYRQFRKSIGLSLVAIGSIALGIGASSAIFSLVYAVLFDPYPYKDPERIISPTCTDQRGRPSRVAYTAPDFLELRDSSKTLEDAFLVDPRTFVVTEGLAERVNGRAYSPNFFDFMGVGAILGRTFGPGDIPSPATPPPITVLSYLYWQRHFNSDPGVVGQTIELNHQPYTILGVLPPRFTWNDAEVYVPLPMVPDSQKLMNMVARIEPGLELEAADAELQAMTERFAARTPERYPREFRMNVKRLNDSLLGQFRGTLLVLLAAVGCLLLLACGNVSILLLARASARQKEIAVRTSIGASRGRVIRQLLTESILLAATGGLLGVLLAYRGVPAIVELMPEFSVPHEAVIAVNGPVVLFSFVLSVLSGTLFGMAPALQLASADIRETLDESGRAMSGSGRVGKLRGLLIISEVALTMVLLVGAGIALRGLFALIDAPLGYDPSNVVHLGVVTGQGEYATWQERRVHFESILEKLRATPGVESATALIGGTPPRAGFEMPFVISGQPEADLDPDQLAAITLVGEDYFSTIRVPRLWGRDFTRADLVRAERVAIINEEMRRRYFPEGDFGGQRIRLPGMSFEGNPSIFTPPPGEEWFEIIGVVASARNRGTQEPPVPAVYFPYTLVLPPNCSYLVRTQGDPSQLFNTLRRQVLAVDADQPATFMRTLGEVLERSERAYPRFSTVLFGIFAFVGLLLAATGLHSVVSYTVARRTHEFGIRMAMGARGKNILGLAVGTTAKLMLAGIAIGLGGSLVISRLVTQHVAGWDPGDPAAFVAVAVMLLAVAVAACWFPVRRAMVIQPVDALRHD